MGLGPCRVAFEPAEQIKDRLTQAECCELADNTSHTTPSQAGYCMSTLSSLKALISSAEDVLPDPLALLFPRLCGPVELLPAGATLQIGQRITTSLRFKNSVGVQKQRVQHNTSYLSVGADWQAHCWRMWNRRVGNRSGFLNSNRLALWIIAQPQAGLNACICGANTVTDADNQTAAHRLAALGIRHRRLLGCAHLKSGVCM